MLLDWEAGCSAAVTTKTTVWLVFVLQGWKNGFHIGTICAATSDSAQRTESIGGVCAVRIRSIPAASKRNELHVGARRRRTHAHQLLLFVRQPSGLKMTHANVLLSDGGRAAWAGEAKNI